MKLIAFVASSFILAGSAAVATYVVVQSGAERQAAERAESTRAAIEQLTTEVRALNDQQQEIEARLASVESRPVSQTPSVASTTATADAVKNKKYAAVVHSEDDEPEVVLEDELDAILDRELSHREHQKAWRTLSKAGLLDDAILTLEEYAEENSDDPDAQSVLGHSYIQKVMQVNDLEKGIWAMKAHGSYDKALELDDHHWEARFSKATSFAFAPPALGLQSKAVEHFEILRSQQEEQETQSHFSHTYTMLGNVYQSMGNKDKAREVWQKGVDLFPDSGSLKEKLVAVQE